METTVAENYFAYNGSKYHRAKSENVVIGAVGEKKTPLGRTSYLAVEFPIAREHLEDRVRYITRAKLNWSRLTKGAWESEGQVSYFTLKGEGKGACQLREGQAGQARAAQVRHRRRRLEAHAQQRRWWSSQLPGT